MGDKTGIQWTEATWNPVRGCSRVSPECDNCYAIRDARRTNGEGGAYEGLTTIRKGRLDWSGIVRFVPSILDKPLRWRRPRRIFVNSMSDLFHESLSFEEIAAIFGVMAACPRHTFQVLTKRPKRALEFFAWLDTWNFEDGSVRVERLVGAAVAAGVPEKLIPRLKATWPLPNVWLGVSAGNQEGADERIPLLLQCPAAVHFVSAEPLLGSLSFSQIPANLAPIKGPDADGFQSTGDYFNALNGSYTYTTTFADGEQPEAPGHYPKLDWVIVGGESGHAARPCDTDWIRAIAQDCKLAGVACFVKQLGSKLTATAPELVAGIDGEEPQVWKGPLDVVATFKGKNDDPTLWPVDLRVQQYPLDRRDY